MGAPARRWGMAPGRRRGQRCGGRGGEGALALRLSLKGFWLHPPPPEDSPVPPGHTWVDTRVWGIPIPLTCVRCNQESAAFCFAEEKTLYIYIYRNNNNNKKSSRKNV